MPWQVQLENPDGLSIGLGVFQLTVDQPQLLDYVRLHGNK
jgi:hypothetical protein